MKLPFSITVCLMLINSALLTQSTHAQTVDNSFLTPIIDLILNNTANSPSVPNNAPINSVPLLPLEFDLEEGSIFSLAIPVNVNDVDGNLVSIQVTTPANAILDIENRPIGDITFNDDIDNGFIITGIQEELITAIENLILIPLGSPSIEITVISIDERGASDEDSFIVNVTNTGPFFPF